MAAALERHRRLRRPLFALSAGHRREQRPDQFLAGGLRPGQRAALRQRGVHDHPPRHRRPAERHRRRRPELAVRRRDLQVRQEQRAAADRRHLGSGVERADDLPRLLRRLLRSGAGRHLRAERVRQPAVRQHGEHPERSPVEPRVGDDVDHQRRAEPDWQRRRFQDAANAAVECRRAAADLHARRD